ncbi:glucosamine-6-phosphate deaminase [Paenibacillus chartarius]|uniref:Glucosamine-6-phosphate deaminase n=1 Tax=Paenibacillus chartarius TaxID=747481 RepID=A0ABV6DL76_9BACL
MNIRIFNSQEDLNEAAADLIGGLVLRNPSAVLGLATGGTPVGIYASLVRRCAAGIVRFRDVTTFNLDEYVGLPKNHPESYFSYMRKHLFDAVDARPERCHLPDGSAADIAAECARYDGLLAQAGRIDLQLLGIGHNGHIGFNEPDHALLSGTHVVELKPSTREANARFFDSPEQVPTHAITMGIGSILKAQSILLVARGADKAEIMQRALYGPITTDCPASLLQTHADLHVYVDTAAGRLLNV